MRGEARGKTDGPTFALLGELDGLVVAGHPVADPQTGAAHACGHNAQVAGMLGAAMGLVGAKAFEHLAGRVVFFAVPAEEYGDVAWRVEQARAGKLEFLGGKPELLRLGHFDDVDMAMMIHLTPQREYRKAGVAASNNGCIVKTVRYIGRASHAGERPISVSTPSMPRRSGSRPSMPFARPSGTRTPSACIRSSPTGAAR